MNRRGVNCSKEPRVLIPAGLFLLAMIIGVQLVHFFSSERCSSAESGSMLIVSDNYDDLHQNVVHQEEDNWVVGSQDKYLEAAKKDSKAILYLLKVDEREKKNMKESITTLYKNYNAKFRHPVVVFYDYADELNDTQHRELLEIQGEVAQIAESFGKGFAQDLEYVPLNFSMPAGMKFEFVHPRWQKRIGYLHMIRLWVKMVFKHPRIRTLEYYVRLDTDSAIRTEIEKDFFDYPGIKYGYKVEHGEDPEYCQGFRFFLADFADAHGSVVSKYIKKNGYERRILRLSENDPGNGMAIYYNNFEVVHIPTFLRPDIQEYIDAVDKTGRIYTGRWGDALIRHGLVNFFLDRSTEVKQFCEFTYFHEHFGQLYEKSC